MVLSHSDFFFNIFCCLHNLMNIFAKKKCPFLYSVLFNKGKKIFSKMRPMAVEKMKCSE